MSVQTFVPGQISISLTDTALKQASREILKQSAQGLRLAVKPAGCSGYKYVLDYVMAPQADDVAVKASDEVTLFVDPQAATLVNGTELDYVTEGLNHFFRFNNPNVTGECGCGESFTVSADV